MPEVSRFYGISVRFYYRDHPPTHFHAFYAEHEALIEIDSGSIHRGYLPPIALNLVNSWRLTLLRGFEGEIVFFEPKVACKPLAIR